MKIRHLFLILNGMAALAAAALVLAYLSYYKANSRLDLARHAAYNSYLLADELRQSSDDLTRLVRTYAATADPAYKDQYFAVLDIRNGKRPRPQDYNRIYWDFVAAGNKEPRPNGETIPLRDLMRKSGFTEEEFGLLDEAAGKSDGLVNLEVEAMKLIEKQPMTPEDQMKAIQLVNSADYHRYKSEIMGPIDRFYVVLDARLSKEISESQASTGAARIWMIAAIVTLITLMATYSLLIFFRIVGRLSRLGKAMSLVSHGELSTSIPEATAADEIGGMARSLEGFRQAALSKQALEESTALERQQAEQERQRISEDAERAAAQRMQEATSELASALEQLAAGDLSRQLGRQLDPQFENLRHDLNSAIGKLGDALGEVAEAASAIDNGTGSIAHGSSDLSVRTEKQAETLGEITEVLSRVVATIAGSSNQAAEARSVIDAVNASATKSGKAVRNAVDAMKRIEESSHQISNIISVIDSIAFQTNLLALNAGVEAARAGSAGKGFAVVAQEVRELAQRSAAAAKEINALISNSAAAVQQGVVFVSETGEALEALGQSISTVNHHMDAVVDAAKEQSAQLAEVNRAMTHLDQINRENVELVDETALSAARLMTQTARLKELLDRFRMPSGTRSGAERGSRAA